MKAGYRDRITEDPDEKESEEFHMSHTREEEWKQSVAVSALLQAESALLRELLLAVLQL